LLTFRKVVAVLDGRLHFDAINPDGPTHRYAGSVLVAGGRGGLEWRLDQAHEYFPRPAVRQQGRRRPCRCRQLGPRPTGYAAPQAPPGSQPHRLDAHRWPSR